MWKVVYQSVAGTSHNQNGSPCQDGCRVVEHDDGSEQILVIACADGPGSSSHSNLGARLACDRFVELATGHFAAKSVPSIDDDIARAWFVEIRRHLRCAAEEHSIAVREFACTLLGAIVAPSHAAFTQVGDGAIVIGGAEGFQSVFWPQSGEYVNMTNFVTDDTIESLVEFASYSDPISEVAMFTDGLERLILRFADRTVHQPFLTPMIAAIKETDDVQPYFRAARRIP